MDWLFHFRKNAPGMFSLITSPDVLTEVRYSWRRDNPKASDSIIEQRMELVDELMDEIQSGTIQADLESFTGTDVNDYHVHAAAIDVGANYILTANAPTDITTTPDEQPYSVIVPDKFLCLCHDSAPRAFRQSVIDQFIYWSNRDTMPDLEGKLASAGCPVFAQRVDAQLYVPRKRADQ